MTEKKNNMKEIRWHGRGGQGAKTAATLVAQVVLKEGKFSQGFPEYGPERMGAPIKGYTRISDGKISSHCNIANPDIVVVLDVTLLDVVDVCEGIESDGILLLNTPETPAEVKASVKMPKGVKVATVDANTISREEIGRQIPNTPMMGALVKVSDILKLETLEDDIRHKFEKKFGEKIVQGNIKAVQRAFEEVTVE